MDYLTVKEVAELKNCSISYISRLIKTNKISAESKLNPETNKIHSLIPVSALSEDLQAKYYARLKENTGLAPELKDDKTALKQRKNTVKRAFEEYSEAERAEIAEWCGIVREWQELRVNYKNKTTFDSDFVGKCRIEHPNLEISERTLYRKYSAYLSNDYDGLTGTRGGWNRGVTSIDEEVWKMFTRIYLVASRPTVSRCYTDVKAWCATHFPELYGNIPSERTFRRRIENEIPDCVIEFTRYGKKACFDRYIEYKAVLLSGGISATTRVLSRHFSQ